MRKIKVADGKFYSKMVRRRVPNAKHWVVKHKECEALLSLRVCQTKNRLLTVFLFFLRDSNLEGKNLYKFQKFYQKYLHRTLGYGV